MTVKVKRGLGLLVVALLAFIVFYPLQDEGGLPAQLATGVAGLTLFVAGFGGLVLIAWGLLRD